jgi:hypothetical protein
MNNTRTWLARFRISFTVLGALLLCSCTNILTTSSTGIEGARLAACTGTGSMFETLPFSKWPDTYHKTVADVIDAHENTLRDTNIEELQCTAPDYPSIVKPTLYLKNLAKTLAPWKDTKKLNSLSEMDIGPVLLEYVRIYECALAERKNYLSILVPREFASSASAANTTKTMDRISYNEAVDTQSRTIDHELAISRLTLNRTMLIVGGEDRLRPLSLDIECLKRVSLDIRNIMGLISQASACMPRIRDARGSLRDLPNPSN